MVKRTLLVFALTTITACGSCFETESVLFQDGADTGGGMPDTGTADMNPRDMVDGGEQPSDMGPVDMGPADMGPVDMGPVDMGPADMGPDVAPEMGVDMCVPDDAATFCMANSAQCGSLTATDNCGGTRTENCGMCSANATCGQNVCTCDSGYDFDGSGCIDIDECVRGIDGCDTNATCTNQIGTFECMCNAGYTGDGFTCSMTTNCGDGTCDVQGGETYETCAMDCSEAIEIGLGHQHTCALLIDGSVRCWGYGLDGELGHGMFSVNVTPVKALFSQRVKDIGVASHGTCGVLEDGTVECCGLGNLGQLGNGMTQGSATPVAVSNLVDIDHVNAGDDMFCAWQDGGSAWCWGDNDDDRLGVNIAGTMTATPLPLDTTVPIYALGMGDQHGCFLDAVNTLYCWGRDQDGEIGNGASIGNVPSPQDIGLAGVSTIGLGEHHSCAVMSTGTVKCWGLNEWGQIGDQTMVNRVSPTDAIGVSGMARVAGTGDATCALATNGSAQCWGEGDNGHLGNGMFLDNDVPQTVLNLTDGVAIDGGLEHFCVIRATGEVVCWGQGNNGKLGYGGITDVAVPTAVSAW